MSEFFPPGLSIVGVENQLAPAGAANFGLRYAKPIQTQEVSGGLNVAFAEAFAFTSKADAGKGSAENSCLQTLAVRAEVEHSLQQGWIGDVGIAGCVFAVFRAFGEHEMVGAADLVHRIPQAQRDPDPTMLLMANGCAEA